MAASLQTSSDFPSRKQVFIPQETLDHPFDVTLVIEDEKEFKAHRGVLSEASPFFEKLFNSDMRESYEGVVRLEMLTELCLRDVLEFIYTGSVQISAVKDNAQDLIAIADYLVFPHLKTLAENCLAKNLKLNDSNAISTYYFAERYRCEDLIRVSKSFILANFTTVAKTEDYLNLPSEEVKMWISSDEINISAEEDVFTLILTWIDSERSERKKYFTELFREVRLAFISRDYLLSDIMTNDLVNDNEGCTELVKAALRSIDAKNYHHLIAKPRTSLTTTAIVFLVVGHEQEDQIQACYYPREDVWSQFCAPVPSYCGGKVIGCHGELYFLPDFSYYESDGLLRHDPFSDCWKTIPYLEQRIIRKVFVRNEDEIYVLSVSKLNGRTCWGEYECVQVGHGKHLNFITKYKPESNSWEDITSFDMGSRVNICVVAKDNFIYFLGGFARSRKGRKGCKTLTDADRYDLKTDTWGKIAEFHQPRYNAYGAVAYGKIFIAGGTREIRHEKHVSVKTCEVYNETADEWYLIQPSSLTQRKTSPIWVCADEKLFVFNSFINSMSRKDTIIECYDPDNNLWKEITQIPLQRSSVGVLFRYSARVKTRDVLKEASLCEECSIRCIRSHKHPLDVAAIGSLRSSLAKRAPLDSINESII